MENLQIKVQYVDETMPRLTKIAKGDWIDLYSAEEVSLKKGEFKLINLGVAMKLPEGYEGHLAPRSSTFKNWKIIQTNSVGVVDQTYCGPTDWWRLPAYATEDVVIPKHAKIAQFRIMRNQPTVEIVEGAMEDEDRGGFGSTGST